MDYGISLRCDSGKLVLKKLVPMLKLLILLRGGKDSTEYIRCILVQLQLLKYHQQHDDALWTMFCNQFSVFNEESGEISFSILARTVLGHSNKSDLEHMNTMYRQINRVRQIDDSFQNDGGATFKSDKNWHKKFTSDSEMVTTIGQFVKARVREIAIGRFTQYDGKTTGYTNIEKAREHQIPFAKTTRFWKDSIEQQFDHEMSKVKEWEGSNVGSKVVSVWPEILPGVMNDAPAPGPVNLNSVDEIAVAENDDQSIISYGSKPDSDPDEESSVESFEELVRAPLSEDEREPGSVDHRRAVRESSPEQLEENEPFEAEQDPVEEKEQEPVEEEDASDEDPHKTQKWQNWSSKLKTLIIREGRSRKRSRTGQEFMVNDFNDHE